MRILYAEDERDLNDLVTRRLVAEGYGVDSCLDGQQAWDYLQAADYDAAILDIMMPHLDGLRVLETSNDMELEQYPRIIVLSFLATKISPG